MGSIFGKESVKEPPHEVLFRRTTGNDDVAVVATPYELRKYATRYAACVEYNGTTSNGFQLLAKYIGVFGTPQNEGKTNIAMTAPVVMEDSSTHEGGLPTPIAMTAPVVMENNSTSNMKKMMFMLPEEYNDLSQIPTPTNPAVQILQLPSEIGAVHRYNGKYNSVINEEKAQLLGRQLHSDLGLSDGVMDVNEEYVSEHYQFWGYNPPFTLPYFRRNEVWIPLREDHVRILTGRFPSAVQHGGGTTMGGGSTANKTMSKTTMISLGLCGLVVSAYAVGVVLNRSRAQYRRL